MATFIVRRTIWTLLVLFAISVLVFLLFFSIPGIDPAVAMAGRNPHPDTIRAIRHAFGLDRALPIQYLMMMKHLFVSRDLESYTNRGIHVIPEITAAAPVTFSLVAGAVVLWLVFGIGIGLLAAVFRGKAIDRALMIMGLVAIAVPSFLLGEVANLITQSKLHNSFLFSWVPPLGYTPLTQDPVMWFKHLLIPWVVLASAPFIGLYSRILRSSLVDVMHEDFVRTARAKGLSERRVLIRHVLRASMISFVSLFGLDLGSLVGGGVVLIEVVFALPGVGLLTFQAASGLDLPVIMATVMYGAFFIVLANLLVDISYTWLDPRIRPA